jgi:hypothetical protein
MDNIDYDPDILDREARLREQQTPALPPPEHEALQQMLAEAHNREYILRIEMIRRARGQ